LSEAHEHGVFHRDLKPDNIFIETVGVSKVVKVLDFGIAGGVDATRLTQAGEVFGTPQYMSPEQCNGLPLDHRTDIYSLGCILYEMIEGRPPFSAETPMATMLKHVRAKVPAPRRAGTETARVMLMSLRKDRSKRIQTAGRFAELIGHCIGALRALKEGRGPDSSKAIPVPSSNTGSMPVNTQPPTTSAPGMGRGMGQMGGHTGADKKGLFIALGLGGLALAVVLLLVFGNLGNSTKSETTTTPTTTPTTTTNEKAPKSHPYNRPLVRANVPAAKVFVDGKEQCETPCVIMVPVGDDTAHEIRLTKEGYVDVVQNWKPKTVGESLPPLPDLRKL
jgi:serine/threonine protein kinase